MATSPANLLTSLQQGVQAINNLAQALKLVTTTSSAGVLTIHLTQVSS